MVKSFIILMILFLLVISCSDEYGTYYKFRNVLYSVSGYDGIEQINKQTEFEELSVRNHKKDTLYHYQIFNEDQILRDYYLICSKNNIVYQDGNQARKEILFNNSFEMNNDSVLIPEDILMYMDWVYPDLKSFYSDVIPRFRYFNAVIKKVDTLNIYNSVLYHIYYSFIDSLYLPDYSGHDLGYSVFTNLNLFFDGENLVGLKLREKSYGEYGTTVLDRIFIKENYYQLVKI